MFKNLKESTEFFIWKNINQAPHVLIQLWQRYRLRNLVMHHYQYNPFYRTLLQERGLTIEDIKNFKREDLRKLPVLTKETFRKYPLEWYVARNIASHRFALDSTSGSTGNPFVFWRDRKYDSYSQILTFKILRSRGISHKSRIVALRLITPHSPPNILQAAGLDLYDPAKNKNLVKQILDFKGEAIFSFPSFLYEFCDLLQKMDFSFQKPLFKAAVSFAETLDDEERKFIEDTLGCGVLDRYGLEELWCFAEDCRYHNGFHLYPESHILEIVDDSGNPSPPGIEGRIVVTYFDNEIMPFIRYDTGDYGMIRQDKCPCGNPSLFFSLKGRRPSPKIWVMKDDQKVSSRFFYLLFLDFAHQILRYQAVKKSDNSIEIRIVPRKDFAPSVLNELESKIKKEAILAGLKVDFVVVDKIPPAPHGKREDFVDES